MRVLFGQTVPWRDTALRLWVASRIQGRDLWASAIDALYPPYCVWCGKEMISQRHWNLCKRCRDAVVEQSTVRCLKCAMPRPRGSLPDDEVCASCRKARFCFSAVAAAGNYACPLKESVILAKRSEHAPLAKANGQLAAHAVRSQFAGWRPDVVTYVPVHWTKRIRRGYCAAEYMSKVVAERIRSPQRTLLVMRRAIGKQGTLSPAERQRNVIDAFEVSAKLATAGRTILVVDDVMTTGATANAVAKALLSAGALEVRVGVAVRGIGDTG